MTLWLGVAAALLLPAAAEDAGKIEYVATVKAPEAEVRSGAGASDQLYSTNRLHKGDKVEVVKELEGGWLAIKPPTGSFSWINGRFVQALDVGKKTWVVVAHPEVRVPLLMGSNVHTTKPTVEGVSVVRGTQLMSVGPMKVDKDDGSRWLPVEPPPSEVRYIRAEAVTRGSIADPPPATASKGQDNRVAAKPPQPAPSQPAPAAAVVLPAGWVSSGPGRLVAAGNCIAYQRTYVLLNSRGLPIIYVVAPKGYSLETYRERNVEIFGVRQHSQDLRADYLTAMQVKLLP